MVLVAREDTYAVESVGPDATVRRRVMAGARIPDGWEVEGATEEVDENSVTGRTLTRIVPSPAEDRENREDAEDKPAAHRSRRKPE